MAATYRYARAATTVIPSLTMWKIGTELVYTDEKYETIVPVEARGWVNEN